jgi:alpha-mannosidase
VISHPNVIASSVKNGENGGIILRLYEATGAVAEDVTVTLPPQVAHAAEMNLLEEPARELNVKGGKIQFTLQPFEIRTIGLTLHHQAD